VKTKYTAAEINAALAQCYGTSQYFKHIFGMLYTDGVQTMAEMCEAYWLIDIVASYQGEKKYARESFQAWTIETTDHNTATVTCTDGNDKFIGKQEIEYTDFPLIGKFTMWKEGNVLILPSEH